MEAHNVAARLLVVSGQGSLKISVMCLVVPIIVEPHEAGMRNVLWAQMNQNCTDPVHVVDAICNAPSGSCSLQKNSYLLLSGQP
jgi:hypothetical protein